MIVVRCMDKDREALASVPVEPATLQDDGVDYMERRVAKPWGHEIERYRDERVSVWWLHLHTDKQTSMHCHPNKTTMLNIIGGNAILTTLNGTHRLSDGDVVIVEPGAFHQTKADGGPLVLYEYETPPNKNDLVRLYDIYGRGQGYEKLTQTHTDQ